jgi:hypothetical protein
MANKPYIVADPPELQIGDQDVALELKSPPDDYDSVSWTADPPNGAFDVDDLEADWHPKGLVAEAVYTIQAEVRDDDDNVIATVKRGIVVCAPNIVRSTPEVIAGTATTYSLRSLPAAAQVGKRFFYAINGTTIARVVDPDDPFTVDGNYIPASPFRLQVFTTPTAGAVRAGVGGGPPDFNPDTVVAEIFETPAPRVAPAAPITLRRTDRPPTPDQILWVCIRNSTSALSFRNFQTFLDIVFCGDIGALCDPNLERRREFLISARELAKDSPLRLPFPGVDPYRLLKAATEVFVTSRCGVLQQCDFPPKASEERRRGVDITNFSGAYQAYLDSDEEPERILPYMALVLARLGEVRLVRRVIDTVGDEYEVCEGILRERLTHPCLIELIWSYWHEEGMLAQCMNVISQRFQNLRAPGSRDPLAQLEIDPLRPLNNLLWGYVQDEQHRLSVLRRAHEYGHHYGMPLIGKALSDLRAADVRSKFVESYHNLLYQTLQFYRQDDDTTVVADAFPVLNALKETHYLLAQGAHNQFGDLPSTSRQEMLIEQWLLSRPEMREFLGGRVMVPYPEAWMDKVDAVKTLKGWTDVSVVHFHDLAVFGEQILLSVRYGAWSIVNEPDQAANWARYWRPEVQGYMHGYRAATGVDLTSDITDHQQLIARSLPPSAHLRDRLAFKLGGRGVAQIATGRITAQVVTSSRAALPAATPGRPQLTKGGQ